MIPRFSKENFPNVLKVVDGLQKVGEKHGASAGQVAIAWVLAQGDDIIPIVGTTKIDVRFSCTFSLHHRKSADLTARFTIKNLKENLGAYNVKLTAEDIAEVRRLVEAANITGDRYPEDFLLTLFIDTPPLRE